eukprot:jgi/Botrbrau1/3302/Bobra.174_1s0064.1
MSQAKFNKDGEVVATGKEATILGEGLGGVDVKGVEDPRAENPQAVEQGRDDSGVTEAVHAALESRVHGSGQDPSRSG